jgi:hypothetical protein
MCVSLEKTSSCCFFFMLFDYFDVIVLEIKKNKENYFDICSSEKYI